MAQSQTFRPSKLRLTIIEEKNKFEYGVDIEEHKKQAIHEYGAILSQIDPDLSQIARMIKMQMTSKNHPLSQLISQFHQSFIKGLRPKLAAVEHLFSRVEMVREAKLDDLIKIRKLMTVREEDVLRLSAGKNNKTVFATTINQKKFKSLLETPEIVFTEVVLMEI